jgi:hypothetical protein
MAAGILASLIVLLGVVAGAQPADAAWTVVFRDDGRPQWQQLFKLVGPPCNVVGRNAASLRVTSCPLSVAGSRAAMVWPKLRLSGGIKVEFDYTHFSAAPVVGGTKSALMLFARGDGSAGWPADVTTWNAQCCGNPSGYGPKMWGLQLNFASRNDPRGPGFMRLRALKGSTRSYQELGLSTPNFPFVNARTYRFTVTRAGSTLTIRVRDSVTGQTGSFVVTHPYIGSLGPGWVGFRQMQARSSRIANFRISTGS